jgi:hypothetical protein
MAPHHPAQIGLIRRHDARRQAVEIMPDDARRTAEQKKTIVPV